MKRLTFEQEFGSRGRLVPDPSGEKSIPEPTPRKQPGFGSDILKLTLSFSLEIKSQYKSKYNCNNSYITA